MFIDGVPISASIFDITVYAFNNLKILTDKLNQSCYFYLSGINFYEESLFWDDLLSTLESLLSVPQYTFKVTLIVDSVIALHELDEIVFGLRSRLVALNAGKWNYLSSLVKRYQSQPSSQIESRSQIKVESSSTLQAFNLKVVHTAHKRGIHAIGGANRLIPRANMPKVTQMVK